MLSSMPTGSELYSGSQNFSNVYKYRTLSFASFAASVILLSNARHCYNETMQNEPISIERSLLESVLIWRFAKWSARLWPPIPWFDPRESWISSFVFSSNPIRLEDQCYPLRDGSARSRPKPNEDSENSWSLFLCVLSFAHLFHLFDPNFHRFFDRGEIFGVWCDRRVISRIL